MKATIAIESRTSKPALRVDLRKAGRKLLTAACAVAMPMAVAGILAQDKNYGQNLAHYGYSSDICSALHLKQATESPTAQAVGLFCGLGRAILSSSVPCGALMRPLPVSGVEQRGAELFPSPEVCFLNVSLKSSTR